MAIQQTIKFVNIFTCNVSIFICQNWSRTSREQHFSLYNDDIRDWRFTR